MSISNEQVNTATVNPDSRFRHPGVLLTGVGGGGVGCYQRVSGMWFILC